MHPQSSLREATEDKGHLEVQAKDLIELHQVFRLCAAGNIVENCPEKENKYLSNCFVYICLSGNSGVDIIGLKVTNHLVPICRVLRGKVFGQKALGLYGWGPSFTQVDYSG